MAAHLKMRRSLTIIERIATIHMKKIWGRRKMPPFVDDQLAAIKTNGESFQTVTLFAQKDMGVMSKTREMIRTATLTMHDHENDVCLSRNIPNSQRASRTKKRDVQV